MALYTVIKGLMFEKFSYNIDLQLLNIWIKNTKINFII